MPIWTLLVVLSIASMQLFAGESDDGCLKLVFSYYCLGGRMSQQIERQPVDMQPVVNGDRAGVIYAKGRERIYVMSYQDRIYKILRTYDSHNQVTLQRLQRTLRNKYGDHQDMSIMPGHTRNLAARIGAVRRGEGEILYRWQPPGEAWRVELGWTRRLGIFLVYLANALDRQQREASQSDL